jgi:Tfp pilus assembly protein FimT
MKSAKTGIFYLISDTNIPPAFSESPFMKTRPKGFGTIDIIIAIFLLAILIAIAVPSFKHYRAHQLLQNGTEDLRNVILISEKEALVFHHPVIICPTLDEKICSTSPKASTLISFIDTNHDAKLSNPDQMIDVLNLKPSNLIISYRGFPYGNTMHVLSPNNRISSNGTFTVTSDQTHEYYTLQISKSGVVHAGYD